MISLRLYFSTHPALFMVAVFILAVVLGAGGTFGIYVASQQEHFGSLFGPSTPTPTVVPTAMYTPAPHVTFIPTPQSSGSPTPTAPPVLHYTNRDSSYDINVMVISYFPLTSDGKHINLAVTGDYGESYAATLQKTRDMTTHLVTSLTNATKYLAYKNDSAPASLRYHVVDRSEYTQAVPLDPNTRAPLYDQILKQHKICEAVSRGVQEVWIWAYQGPTYPGSQYAYLNISESKMSGPHGDISNSLRLNDMPQCGKTYTVYTFNYQRGTGEAMHSWGHQVESELREVDLSYFVNAFQGPYHPQATNQNGRCGSVHNPPNARHEYDYNNPTPQLSDCLSWGSDQLGLLSYISCTNWGCDDNNDTDNAHLNYMTWMWQNLPGRNNPKRHEGVLLRNLWDVHADFDTIMSQQKTVLSQY